MGGWQARPQRGCGGSDIGTANLQKIEHIVVLMLENRSFDHMLGYLSLEGGRADVDGLREELANDHDGRRYPVRHLDTTAIPDDPITPPAPSTCRSAAARWTASWPASPTRCRAAGFRTGIRAA